MTSIALKTLNFDQDASKQDAKTKSFNIEVSLDSESPKSVSYTVRWQLAKRRSGSASTKTMAEISADIKNQVSHRAKALEALKDGIQAFCI